MGPPRWISGTERTLGRFPYGLLWTCDTRARAGRHGCGCNANGRAERSGNGPPSRLLTSCVHPPQDVRSGPAARLRPDRRNRSNRKRQPPGASWTVGGSCRRWGTQLSRSPTTTPWTLPLSSARRRATASVAHGWARKAAAPSSVQCATLPSQRDHAVAREHTAVAGFGRHEIPLRRDVQPDRPGHPLPQRPPDRPGPVGGVGLVAAAGEEVPDVVHQPGCRQLVVAGMEMRQQRRSLQGVVELGDGDARAERVVGARGQDVDDVVGWRSAIPPPAGVISPLGSSLIRTILPRCGYGAAPCPGPLPHAVPGPTRWWHSGAASATTDAPWSRCTPRLRRPPPSAPPASMTSVTAGGRSPSAALLGLAGLRGAPSPPGPHPHPGRAPADPEEPPAHGRPVEEGTGRAAPAGARAHRRQRASGAPAPPSCTSCWPATPTTARRCCGSCCTPSPTTTPRAISATTRSRSWTRSCPRSRRCTRTAAASPPSASLPSVLIISSATCTRGSTTWRSTRCGAAVWTRPRSTTGTSAICRRCSG